MFAENYCDKAQCEILLEEEGDYLFAKALGELILPIQLYSLGFYSLTLSQLNTCKYQGACAQVLCPKLERPRTFCCPILTFFSGFLLVGGDRQGGFWSGLLCHLAASGFYAASFASDFCLLGAP